VDALIEAASLQLDARDIERLTTSYSLPHAQC
jgi:hypothetical protein